MTRIPYFHEEMERFQFDIPTWVGHNLNRLRGDRAKWLRVPTGVALIGGGVLGFLRFRRYCSDAASRTCAARS